MISIGEKLDLSFPVRGYVAGEKWEGTLIELIQRPTIVSVYMRNNTSSCDKQTQQMKQAAEALEKMGVGLVGLSKDTPGSHQKYACKLELGFPLVSDPDHAFAKATKSLVEKKMYGKVSLGPTRSAYLIDPSGELLGCVEKVDSANHGKQLLELVNSVQLG